MSTSTAATDRATGAATSANIQVHNTLTRRKEPFQPVVPGKVGIYLCGPTVYREAHIGHMVGPVLFDTIKRYLAYCGYEVTWVVNITDVDDKLITESNRRGIPMAQVAGEMTADYLQNLAALGVDQIDHMPRATEHMSGICRFIQRLVDRGFAYESEGDVYFEVAKDKEYGKLSNRTADSMQGEGGETAARKRAPGDFALWKRAKPGEPSWDSPWGKGRPGWHIECSAMSHELLGETFDIHGGGLDLVFPHHENEVAQSECCHGRPMVKYWMHNGLMRASTAAGKVGGRQEREDDDIDGKISRSKGAGGLAELISRQGGERIRFFLLRTHYRSTIVFGEEGLAEAGAALESFYRFFDRYQRISGSSFYDLRAPTRRTDMSWPVGGEGLRGAVSHIRERFLSKMDDDFNTGAAVSELFELLRALNKFADQYQLEDSSRRNQEPWDAFQQGTVVLRELSGILGLFRSPLEKPAGEDDRLVRQLMDILIRVRAEARKKKDFATADQVRDALSEIGISLEDRKGGTDWRRV
jgi:cysteinyl-tRNA synthetase